MKQAIRLTMIGAAALALGAAPPEAQGDAEIQAEYNRPALTPAQGCRVNLDELGGICSHLFNRTRLTDGSRDRFLVVRKMRRAACAPTDSEEDLTRIRALWAQHPERFACNSPNFEIAGGNILKYGVSTRAFFIVSTAMKWKLDLNRIDPADGKTFADYVKGKIAENQNPPNENLPQLLETYEQIRANGGKHRSELR